MSACEKCWSDAGYYATSRLTSKADEYQRLIQERAGNPCTPEQQAGMDATECSRCKRRSLHQYTKECMNPACPPAEGRDDHA